MLPLQRLLVPTDFSPCAQTALQHAHVWATRYDADLHLLHAVLPSAHASGKDAREEAEQQLAEPVALLRQAGVPVTPAVVEGAEAADEVLAYAQKTEPDLLVLGTHGRSGLKRLFQGSTTEAVLRRTTVPALVVGQEHTSPAALTRILAPVDLSELSLTTLPTAQQLAAQEDARLAVLHVVEEPLTPSIYDPTLADAVQVSSSETIPVAQGELRRALQEAGGPDVATDLTVVGGFAAATIVEQAGDLDADLIVLATHGRTGWRRLVLGSVTEQVLRMAPCPLLILPAAEADGSDEDTP